MFCALAGSLVSETTARRLLLIAQGCFTMTAQLGERGSCALAEGLARSLIAQTSEMVASPAT